MKLEAYRTAFEQLAAGLGDTPSRATRRAQFERFAAVGFPSKREEDWRYTDLASLSEKQFALPADSGDTLIPQALADSQQLVFVDGRFDAARSSTHQYIGDVTESASGEIDGLAAIERLDT